MATTSEAKIGIGEVVRATGVREATLRSWESRYGFPVPEREPGGHRRYTHDQVEAIKRVARAREIGLPMSLAIARATPATDAPTSIFARLREVRPDLAPQPIHRTNMTHLSRAVENEIAARAEPGLLIGAFQREELYRHSPTASRWRDLGGERTVSFVLADFPVIAEPEGAPVEVPIDSAAPMAAEWTLICVAPRFSVCLVGREPPGQDETDPDRVFEGFLSLEPDVAHAAASAALAIAEPEAPEVVAAGRASLESALEPDPASQLRLSGAITSRFVAALG